MRFSFQHQAVPYYSPLTSLTIPVPEPISKKPRNIGTVIAMYGKTKPRSHVVFKEASMTGSDKNLHVQRRSRLVKAALALALVLVLAGCADGSTTTVITTAGIVWKGSLASAPSSPQVNWAYYNSAEDRSYLWDGKAWVVILEAQEKAVTTLTWRGELAAAPESPALGDAYRNTASGASYIYDGNQWNVVAVDSTMTETLTTNEILWQGSLDAAPTSPATGWAYYNSATESSYLWDGSAWRTLSQSKVTTTNQVTWKGELAAAPSSPVSGDMYYDTGSGVTLLYDGATWQSVASDGEAGASISWQGEYAAAPASPQLNWAYYDTVAKASYIWDGDSWEVLARDSGGSLNVSATVAPGAYLALAHKLGRDDLTFNAQFLKDGIIYDYGEYESTFGTEAVIHSKEYFDVRTVRQISLVRQKLSPYNLMVTYLYNDYWYYAAFVIYGPDGSIVHDRTIVCPDADVVSALALDNGDFVIAYCDRTATVSGSAFFDIYSGDGSEHKVVKESIQPTDICNAPGIYLASLTNGNFLAAFRSQSTLSIGYKLFTSSGVAVRTDATWAGRIYDDGSAVAVAPLSAGGFGIVNVAAGPYAYYDMYLHAFDSSGNLVPCGSARQVDDCSETWSVDSGASGVTIAYDSNSSDSSLSHGSSDMAAVKFTLASGATGNAWIAYHDLASPLDLSTTTSASSIGFWIKSSVDVAESMFTIGLWSGAGRTGTEYSIGFRSPPLVAGQWTWVETTGTKLGSVVRCVALYSDLDSVSSAIDLWIDDIREYPNRFIYPNATPDNGALDVVQIDEAGDSLFIAYTEAALGQGMFRIVTPTTSATATLTQGRFNDTDLSGFGGGGLDAARLSDGNLVVAYDDYGHSQGEFCVFDPDGAPLAKEKVFNDQGSTYVAVEALADGEFAIAFRDQGQGGAGAIVRGGYQRLTLEKTSSNEVRLYNRTNESLTLSLSVNR